jgi:hypothetical protein
MRTALILLTGIILLACGKTQDGAKVDSPPAWEVTIRGYGPIEAGMTQQQAAASGRALEKAPAEFPECNYVGFAGDSSRGVQFMLTYDTIVRVDVNDSTVKTSHGVGIGDTESKVEEAYLGRVRIEPHKYEDGHYLVVSGATATDSSFGLVFETDGKNVTRYRAGRLPEVQFVEGCS